jgi:hypothetical protein
MNIINKTKETFNSEIIKIAQKNIIAKLTKQGINHHDLLPSEFNRLIEDEIKILEHDSKRVGAGIAIGLIIAAMTGGA